jgi:hypothetical protein
MPVWVLPVAFLLGLGVGMVAEARWSQSLILTRAEQQQASQIKALNDRVAAMAVAAQVDADARAAREAADTLKHEAATEEALKHATDKIILSSDLARAIDAAGGVRNTK